MTRATTAIVVLALLLAACAPGRELRRQGETAIAQGRLDEGLRLLEDAARADPDNRELRMQIVRQRERAAAALRAQTEAAREAAVAAAAASAPKAASTAAPAPPPALRVAGRKPVTAEFRDAPLKSVFDALSRSTGVNFVFDRDVKTDTRVTLSVAEIGIEDVIGVVALTHQLGRRVLNENTLLIYPDTPAKAKEYQELAVRTFYLANADVKSVFAMLKTVLKSRDLHADERLNSLTLRDTPDAIRLAERLIAAQDLAEPEVLLDVEVLEIKRSRLTELGIEPPQKFSVLNLVSNPSTVLTNAGGSTTVVDNTLTSTQLTLNRLRDLRAGQIGIDNPSLNLRSEVGDTNILANPRIRVKNKDKARVLIGDRVPVITTTSTANVGVAESVAYLDVGLKLEVEPTVFLDNEVGVKVSLEVSNVVREVRSRGGTLTYQIGTRLANTQLRLRDGQTQALAGLIADEDRRSTGGWPVATDVPLLGRLFSSERHERNKTEIVLLVTPRVVRNPIPALPTAAWPSGTETATGAPAPQLRRPAPSASGPGS
jgi:general secretion pathway protein D